MNLRVVVALFCSVTGSALAAELSTSVLLQMESAQIEKAARTPTERKLDSQLLYLHRESIGRPAVAQAPTITSRVAREADGRVVVEIKAPPSKALRTAIRALGGEVLYESTNWNVVSAKLPPKTLLTLAARKDVRHVAQPGRVTSHTGSVVNQADPAHKANLSRTAFGVTGAGVKVGVISNSDDHSEQSILNGDLLDPLFDTIAGRSGRAVPPDPQKSGEGTAMSEIVADIAPGAHIYFASAEGPGGKAFFADSILALYDAGCRIIVDDISYPNEWQFQDDEIGIAINTLVAGGTINSVVYPGGAVYFSSSGNEGNLKHGNSTTWEGDFLDGGAASAPLNSGRVHSFGSQTYNTLTGAGPSSALLQWSDEYHTSASEYDLFILSADGSTIVTQSANTQDGDDEPMEYVDAVNPGERIVIWKDTLAPARYLRLACTGSTLQFQTAGQTVGHAATANCICVAASDASAAVAGPPFTFHSGSLVEESSSDGPHKMFYNPDGSLMNPGGGLLASGGVTIQTPALTAGDGGQTSVPGFQPFYGTSAAAPAAAAVAALVWEKKPTLTNAQLRTVLEQSCLDIEDPGFEVNSGHGILIADLAITHPLVSPPQDSWRYFHFGSPANTGNAALSVDAEGDGITNLVEYGTGSDPNTADGSVIALTASGGNTYTIAYHRNTLATDVTIEIEHKSDLTAPTWTVITPTSDTLVSANGTVELRHAVVTIAGSDPNHFFRIRVTVPIP